MFIQFGAFVDNLIQQAMDNGITAGIGASLNYMRGALMLFVLIASVMVMAGKLDLWEMIRRGVKAAIIIAILQTGLYQTQVRDLFWTTIPNLTAQSVGNFQTATTQAERYNALWNRTADIIAAADQQVTGWGPSAWRAAFSLAFAEFCMKVFLVTCFAMTVLARISTGLLIAAGPFLLIAFLFDTTRGWVMSWVGKLVGIAVWTLLANLLSEMVLGGTLQWATTVAANHAAGMFGAVDGCWRIALWLFLCAIVLATLPSLTAIGAGAATGVAVGGGVMMNTAVRSAGAAAAGAAGAGKAALAAANAATQATKAAFRRRT
jgi:type IV secretion system protein VirB6